MVVTLAPCLSISICAMDGYGSWYTRAQSKLIPSPACILLCVLVSARLDQNFQAGGASMKARNCPGQIKEQRQELG